MQEASKPKAKDVCLCLIFLAEYVLSLDQFSLTLGQSTYACCTHRPFSQSGLPHDPRRTRSAVSLPLPFPEPYL